jgi:SH3-like domain-containing protein
VLVRSDVVLRSGNGASFEPAIEEPLSEGVEFAILEARPGWWRVRLPDGTTGWVSAEDGERV